MFLKGREEKWKRGGNVQKTKTIHKSNITTRMCLYENHNKTTEKQLSAFYVSFSPSDFFSDRSIQSRFVFCFAEPDSSQVILRFFPGARDIPSHPIPFIYGHLLCFVFTAA